MGAPGVFRYYIPSPFNTADNSGAGDNTTATATTATGGGNGTTGGGNGNGGGGVSSNSKGTGNNDSGGGGGVMDDKGIEGYVLCQTTVVHADDGGEDEVIPNAPGR